MTIALSFLRTREREGNPWWSSGFACLPPNFLPCNCCGNKEMNESEMSKTSRTTPWGGPDTERGCWTRSVSRTRARLIRQEVRQRRRLKQTNETHSCCSCLVEVEEGMLLLVRTKNTNKLPIKFEIKQFVPRRNNFITTTHVLFLFQNCDYPRF